MPEGRMEYVLGQGGFVLGDEYIETFAYPILHAVPYDGALYITKAPSKGNLPTDTTFWVKVAAAGRGVELRKTATHIQRRYEGQTEWTDLIPLADIKGDEGKAATIAVGTTSILPVGSPITITNSGTEHAAVFDFGIPPIGFAMPAFEIELPSMDLYVTTPEGVEGLDFAITDDGYLEVEING